MPPSAFMLTERLALRPFTLADVDALVALDADPEVMRYLTGGVPTPRATIERAVLPAFLASYQGGFGVWAAETRTDDAFIGWFSLRPSDANDLTEATLGYRLRRTAWGRGYATEGARALCRHAFTTLGVARISATTYQDNAASRRVMAKLGMRHVRSFRLTPADLAANDTFDATGLTVWDGDDVEYVITRAEWDDLTSG